MVQQIGQAAFPRCWAVLDKLDDGATEEGMRQAVAEELQRLIEVSWQHRAIALAEDQVSVVARKTNMSRALAAEFIKRLDRKPGDGT